MGGSGAGRLLTGLVISALVPIAISAAPAPRPAAAAVGAQAESFALPPALARRLGDLQTEGRLELRGYELQVIVMDWIRHADGGPEAMKNVTELTTRISDGVILIGGRVNLESVDVDQFGSDGKKVVEFVRAYLSSVVPNPLYLGVRLQASFHDDRLYLGDDVALYVGAVRLPRSVTLNALSLDAGSLATGIAVPLSRYGLASAVLEGDRLVLTAR